MREHRGLGPAGGAAGEDQDERVVLGDGHVGEGGRGVADEAGEVVLGEEQRDAGIALEAGAPLLVHHQELRVGELERSCASRPRSTSRSWPRARRRARRRPRRSSATRGSSPRTPPPGRRDRCRRSRAATSPTTPPRGSARRRRLGSRRRTRSSRGHRTGRHRAGSRASSGRALAYTPRRSPRTSSSTISKGMPGPVMRAVVSRSAARRGSWARSVMAVVLPDAAGSRVQIGMPSTDAQGSRGESRRARAYYLRIREDTWGARRRSTRAAQEPRRQVRSRRRRSRHRRTSRRVR